jgi:hypothetical protein
MRATITAFSVVALLAAGAGSAAAHPADMPSPGSDAALQAQADIPTARTDAVLHARAMRSQGLHDDRLTGVASSTKPAPAPTVRVTRADDGFHWADAGIGAGVATALLLLSAAAVAALRRQPRAATRVR